MMNNQRDYRQNTPQALITPVCPGFPRQACFAAPLSAFNSLSVFRIFRKGLRQGDILRPAPQDMVPEYNLNPDIQA